MIARSALVLLAALAAPASAQAPAQARPAGSLADRLAAAPSLEGVWALTVEGTAILRFDLKPTANGWTGSWQRPRSFASNGVVFTRISGPVVAVPASKVTPQGEWTELTFDDPRPGAVPDVFRLRALPSGKVEAIYVGTGFAPLVLEKVAGNAALGPWPTGKSYQRTGVTAAPGATIVTFAMAGPGAEASVPAPAASPRPTPTPAPGATPQGPPAVIGR